MRERRFGPAGPPVAVIGQGTWQLERSRGDVISALRRGIEVGVTHIDTAEIYGGGAVEGLVGEALEGLRDRVFLVSKIDPAHATRPGALRACEQSLIRLRTDYLDAYLLHWLPPHPLDEVVRALEDLVDAGKIRRWGVSNFDEVKLEELIDLAGAERIACNQVLYHLEERAIEHAVLPCCQRHDIAVVGYSPFAVGAFPDSRSAGGRILAEIGARHGATPRQVALAFLTRLPGTFTIPKASQIAHVEENAGAAKLSLTDAELSEIDQAFPLDAPRAGVPLW